MTEGEMQRERFTLRNARRLAADYMTRQVAAGDIVVDATMGNGYDTLFLCGLVGASGRVYAFDVQPGALERTAVRLEEAGVRARATLLLAGHETMEAHVVGQPSAVMFNLGWLPGSPHGVTTRVDTTLAAVDAAVRMVMPGGLVSICVYPGHEEGKRERQALLDWAGALSVRRYNVLEHRFLNASDDTPLLILVQKNA